MSLSVETEPSLERTADAETLQEMRPIPRISIQAFCESEDVADVLRKTGQDRRLSKAHFGVRTGGIEDATEFYRATSTPNLLILETHDEPGRLMQALEALAEVCEPSTKVVIIGHYNDVSLYRDLMRAGVSDYLIAPVSLTDVITVISDLFVDPAAEPLGRTIAFVGAKGGVGSSMIAHNVSWAMSELLESQVMIADLDLPFGTANINFDQDPPQGIAEAVYSPNRIDEVYLDRLLADCSQHLSLLAAPSSLERTYDFDAEAFSPVIETAQRTVPNVVLDVPHGWTNWIQTTLARADEIVITAMPDLANLRNAKNLIDTLKKLRPNDPAPRLIINQAGIPKKPEISVSEFCDPLGLTPLAVIPFDPQLFGKAANNGRPLAQINPKHPISQTINTIASTLARRRGTASGGKESPLAWLLKGLGRKSK